MNWNDAQKIVNEITKYNTKDEDLIDLRDDFYQACLRYSNLRFKWYFSDLDKKKEMDKERTAAHNALISSWNVLCRYMNNQNIECNSKELFPNDRKNIGDLACYLCAIIGIMSR